MRYLLYSILAGVLAGGAGGAVMGTQESPPPDEASKVKDAKEPPDAKQAKEPSSQEKDTPRDRSQEEELEPFLPSEKIPVDNAISFPVDI